MIDTVDKVVWLLICSVLGFLPKCMNCMVSLSLTPSWNSFPAHYCKSTIVHSMNALLKCRWSLPSDSYSALLVWIVFIWIFAFRTSKDLFHRQLQVAQEHSICPGFRQIDLTSLVIVLTYVFILLSLGVLLARVCWETHVYCRFHFLWHSVLQSSTFAFVPYMRRNNISQWSRMLG